MGMCRNLMDLKVLNAQFNVQVQDQMQSSIGTVKYWQSSSGMVSIIVKKLQVPVHMWQCLAMCFCSVCVCVCFCMCLFSVLWCTSRSYTKSVFLVDFDCLPDLVVAGVFIVGHGSVFAGVFSVGDKAVCGNVSCLLRWSGSNGSGHWLLCRLLLYIHIVFWRTNLPRVVVACSAGCWIQVVVW